MADTSQDDLGAKSQRSVYVNNNENAESGLATPTPTPPLLVSKKDKKDIQKENQSAGRPALIISENLIEVFGSKEAAVLVTEVAASMPCDSKPDKSLHR